MGIYNLNGRLNYFLSFRFCWEGSMFYQRSSSDVVSHIPQELYYVRKNPYAFARLVRCIKSL